MHRYEELEKIYYKKLYLKIFIGFILFIIFVILLFIFLDSGKKSAKAVKPEKKDIQKSQKTVKAEQKDTNKTKQTIQIKKQEKNKKQKIKEEELKFILPNIDFIKEPSEPKQQIKKPVIKKPVEKKEQKPLKTQTKPQNIKITENKVNIKDLINEFKGNKDYNLAITIANIYLKRNDLKNAQIWALNANSLAPSKPESWIIFADIMIKKHNIKKAKDLLKVYIDSYGSNDIIEEKLRSIDGK